MHRVSKIYGPPGTGKTETLMSMVEAELESGTKPERIGFVSFTRAACENARARAAAQLGLDEDTMPWFRTIHSVAYNLLGMIGSGLITEAADLSGFAKLYGIKFSQALGDEVAHPLLMDEDTGLWGDTLLWFDTVARNQLLPLSTVYAHHQRVTNLHVPWQHVEHFGRAYPAWKEANGLLDFTDLLERCHDTLPVTALFVDEAQDLSPLQWQFLDRAAVKVPYIYLAGDDDQALYSWSGANAQLFNQHPGDTQILHQSYRVPRTVHAVAERIASFISERQEKVYHPRDDDGAVQRVLSLEAVRFDPDESTLVLYRNHYLGEWAERLMQIHKLPYSRQGRRTLIETWGPAIRAWERLRRGQTITTDQLLVVLKAMKIGQGKGTRTARLTRQHKGTVTRGDAAALGLDPAWLKKPWYASLTKLTPGQRRQLRDVVAAWGGKILGRRPNVRLSTIHNAKGKEADHVVLLIDMSGRTEQRMRESRQFRDDELRVWYVGVTRAKKRLTLVGVHRVLDNVLRLA